MRKSTTKKNCDNVNGKCFVFGLPACIVGCVLCESLCTRPSFKAFILPKNKNEKIFIRL